MKQAYTSVDREGIISKEILILYRQFQAILLAKTQHLNTKIYVTYLLFVISKWYGKTLAIIGQFGEE